MYEQRIQERDMRNCTHGQTAHVNTNKNRTEVVTEHSVIRIERIERIERRAKALDPGSSRRSVLILKSCKGPRLRKIKSKRIERI